MMPIREAPLYQVGDQVWLNGQNITTCPMKKLDHKWLGLYIVDIILQNIYRLKLP